jgi:hypothetical protein
MLILAWGSDIWVGGLFGSLPDFRKRIGVLFLGLADLVLNSIYSLDQGVRHVEFQARGREPVGLVGEVASQIAQR